MDLRKHYTPLIADIIKENEGKSGKEIKKILYQVNPGLFGNHQKIWTNESIRQLCQLKLL